jgi:hypothetical protein
VFYQPFSSNKQVLYKKLERYYRKEKRSAFFRSNKRLFNKTAVSLVIVLFIFSIPIISVEAFRMKLFNFFVEMRNDHTEIRLQTDPEAYQSGDFTINVPEDYQLYDTQRIKGTLTLTFQIKRKCLCLSKLKRTQP